MREKKRVEKEEIQELTKDLEDRKALRPEVVAGLILKECRQQLTELIQNTIE